MRGRSYAPGVPKGCPLPEKIIHLLRRVLAYDGHENAARRLGCATSTLRNAMNELPVAFELRDAMIDYALSWERMHPHPGRT